MVNLTMNNDGTMKPFFGERYENLNNLKRRLNEVTSRRHNFIVMGFEVFDDTDCVQPGALKRFFRRSWAGDISRTCTVCTDSSFSDPKVVFDDASKDASSISSAVDLLSEGVARPIGDRPEKSLRMWLHIRWL